MSFEVTVTPTVYDVDVSVNPSVQPFDVEVTVGNVPDLDLTTNGDSGASTFDPLTGELNIPNYTLDGLGGVPESRTLTINGTTQDLSANRTFTIPAPDPVTIGSPANGLAIDGNQVLTIGLASVSQAGALSSTDWSTFNNKQNAIGYTPENVANKAINFTSPDDTKYPTTLAVSTALAGKQDLLTNPITGTGATGQIAFWNGTNTQSGDSGLFWDDTNKRLGVGNNSPSTIFHVKPSSGTPFFRLERPSGSIFEISSGSLVAGVIMNVVNNTSLNIRTNNVDRISITSNGNIGIGPFIDAGFKLDVNGTARVQGALSVTTGADVTPLTISGYSLTGSNAQSALSITGTWNTTGTPTALLVNVTDTASNANSLLFDFQIGGVSRIRGSKNGDFRVIRSFLIGGSNNNDLYSTDGGVVYSQNGLYTGLRFGGISTEGFGLTISGFNTSQRTNTSGIAGILSIEHGFAPTSGNSTFIGLRYTGVINQTGGANGITRGLYVNPTLTSAADWRSIEWSNNTGRGLWGVGTANNAMAGATHIGSASNANASAILELTSTTRGFLPPRMTGSQAEAIATPAEGLLVYSTDGTGTTITSKGWWGWSGATWEKLN